MIAIIAILMYTLFAAFALLLTHGAAIGKNQALDDEEQMLYIEKYVQKRRDKLKRKEQSA